MHSPQLKSAIVVVLGAIAYYVLASIVLRKASLLAPVAGGYAALQLANTSVLVALSVPFALLLRSPRLSLKRPVLVALGIALLGLVAPSLPSAPLVLRPGVAAVSAALDFTKFALTLPSLDHRFALQPAATFQAVVALSTFVTPPQVLPEPTP